METYRKDFAVECKLTCTDSPQLSGHLEREKYQRSPHAFQNLFFLLMRGPSTQQCFHSWNNFRGSVFLKSPDPTQAGLPSVFKGGQSICGADGVRPPNSSADLITLYAKDYLGFNDMQMLNPPSHPALKELPFLQHVCIQLVPPQAPTMLPSDKNLQTDRKTMMLQQNTTENPIRPIPQKSYSCMTSCMSLS